MTCAFATRGFPLRDGAWATPCGVRYHNECIKVGRPFTSRRSGDAGLRFPVEIKDWPNFICEKCTVRAVLGRELTKITDWRLLCLERMRVLDMVHAWQIGSHRQYQQKIKIIRQFEQQHGISVLPQTSLTCPPIDPCIPLMWSEEQYSLRPASSRRQATDEGNVAFSTIRQLRSAAAQFQALDLLATNPGKAFVENRSRKMTVQDCRTTDSYSSTLFASGMSARIGNHGKPSQALLERHVRWIDEDLNQRYMAARTPTAKKELAKAGLANCSLWLGWLRSSELFGLTFDGTSTIEPQHASMVDLPRGVGAVQYSLLPETKSMRDVTANCVMAYETFGGFSIGKWFHRVRRCNGLGRDWQTSRQRLFTHKDGTPWTSRYYRDTYLYPALDEQRRQGDTFLVAFDGSPGNSIREKFWSLHCYRRGAASHVTKTRQGQYRKANKDQIYEHARWRKQRKGEAVDILYREWTLRDRIKITLYSQ